MHDLIVVGAGLAGLALGARASAVGMDVLVVDARNRTGGRILSHRTAAGRYDLGPAWIWPAMQPRLARVVEVAGLALHEQAEAGGFLYQDQDGTVQRLPHGFAQNPPSMRIAGGVEALAAHFARLVPPERLRLETKVLQIGLDADGITLGCDTASGPVTLRARQAALALPPRLVAGIDFAPALPAATRHELEAVPTWMAGHAKALAIYDAPFWRAAGLSGGAFSQRGPLAEIHDASLPDALRETGGEAALFGFFGWPAAARAMRRERLAEQVSAQLGALFGPRATTPRALVIHDWSDDELTATGLDRAPLAGHPDYAPIALPAPWGKRVVLAGSETAPEFGGYLEGALAASEAVAARLRAPAAT